MASRRPVLGVFQVLLALVVLVCLSGSFGWRDGATGERLALAIATDSTPGPGSAGDPDQGSGRDLSDVIAADETSLGIEAASLWAETDGDPDDEAAAPPAGEAGWSAGRRPIGLAQGPGKPSGDCAPYGATGPPCG